MFGRTPRPSGKRWAAHRPLRAQVAGQLVPQVTAGLHEQRPVDRLVRHVHHTVPVGNRRRGHPAICSGDHCSSSLFSTMPRSPGQRTNFVCFGQHARVHARWSATTARYRLRQPLRATSRGTVEGPPQAGGDHPQRQPGDQATGDLLPLVQRQAQLPPLPRHRPNSPVRFSRSRTVDGCRRISRASTFTASPDRHRRHTSSTSAGDNTRLRHPPPPHPPAQGEDHEVLR